MEGLGDVNIRSAQAKTRDCRIDRGVESNVGKISKFCSVVHSLRIEDSSSQWKAARTGPPEDFEVIWYGVTQGPSKPTMASDL